MLDFGPYSNGKCRCIVDGNHAAVAGLSGGHLNAAWLAISNASNGANSQNTLECEFPHGGMKGVRSVWFSPGH
jgi:hypothetical protein